MCAKILLLKLLKKYPNVHAPFCIQESNLEENTRHIRLLKCEGEELETAELVLWSPGATATEARIP